MKKSLLILSALTFMFSFADAQQRVLVDFDNENQTPGACFGNSVAQGDFGCYSIIGNPDNNINTSDSVLQLIEPAEGETWMGMFIDITTGGDIDMTTGNTELCADVWSSTVTDFVFKLEKTDGTGGAVALHEGSTVAIATASQWQTVCYDFAGTPADGVVADRLAFFFNHGAIPATEQTYYADNFVQTFTTGTNNVLEAQAMNVFPNPATHNLFFESEGQSMTIVVFDMMGKEVIRHHEYTGNNIRVSDLSTGTYIATFINEATGVTSTAKFVRK